MVTSYIKSIEIQKYNIMKISVLIITESMPYPLSSGGNIAQFEMNNVLRKHVNLKMLFPVYAGQEKDFEELKKLWQDVEFIPIYNSFRSKLDNMVSNLIFRKPIEYYCKFLKKFFFAKYKFNHTEKFLIKNSKIFVSGAFDVEAKYIRAINELVDIKSLDIVQVEFHTLLPIVSYLPKHVKNVYVNHEIRYIREERELSLIKKNIPFFNFLLTKNKGFECSFMNAYDKVVTVSDDDCLELQKVLPPTKVYASPLTIKYKGSGVLEQEYDNMNTLIFLGGEEHFPNKDGIDWFLEHCWINLQSKYPNLKLKIIGKWTDETHKEIKERYSNVYCSGFVPDLSKELKDAVFIVPIRIGSGMRMKIIDAVQNKLPFVSTTIGVEGLNFRKEEDFLVGDSPDEFCTAVERLLSSGELSRKLARNANDYLNSEYSYEKLINRRVNFYKDVMTHK